MSRMNFHPVSLSDTFEGENTVWTQLQAALRTRHGDTFYRLPILDGEGRFMYEPDIVVALRGRMPVVIECKGCRLRDIVSINGAVWTMGETWYRPREKPLNQARDQAIALGQMLYTHGVPALQVHNLVALPFVSRASWEERFGEGLGIADGILFADDIALPERFGARILELTSTSEVNPGHWNRLAAVLGARDRWIDEAAAPRPVAPRPSRTAQAAQVEGGLQPLPEPGITILRYAGRPPTADELQRTIGIDTGTPHTYLVATAALERKRRKEGLGGQHQLKKNLRDDAAEPEEMQLLFHKAIRHFIARPMLTRTEERVLIQRAIRTVAQGNQVVAEQLRRDVFAWRDVLAELEEEGFDLSVNDAGIEWAHPDLKRIATSLQAIYRNSRRSDSRAVKPTFEEAARHYLWTEYVPTSIVVMEGFTRLTPLQQEFIYCCAKVEGLRLCIVLPYSPDQQAGFAALDQTYEDFLDCATELFLNTPVLGEPASLAYLQTELFSKGAVPHTFGDDGVTMTAFPHRNDEVASCVREVIRLTDEKASLGPGDLAIVCSDPQSIMPLLREEAELLGKPELFALPPRQLLLTPVGRFILVLYEVWKNAVLRMDWEQLATLLASGWLGSHAQKGAELFVAVSRQHFTFCRSEADWRSAFDRIERQLGEEGKVLGKVADRLPSSLVGADDVATWRNAIEVVIGLCERIFASGEKPIGKHISLLLDEIEKLDPHGMLRTEREVLDDIRIALADIAESRSVAIDANEFGEVLSGLIHERLDEEDGDIAGSAPGARPRQVWVVGPEGVDNIERHTVFFLGVDDSRMPTPGRPPWPRIAWSAKDHVERQRYRFLAVVRAAQQRLLLSYARQDWEKQYQPSPYLDEAAYLLGHSLIMEAAPVRPLSAPAGWEVTPVRMHRERYTVSELATYRLCPYRFKMEALTRWAGRYTEAWQLEWLARGVWLAEVFHHTATQSPGSHSAEEFRQVIETAIDDVRPLVEAHLPGLRRLAWTGVERQVRSTVEYLLTGKQLPLLGIAIPNPPGKARQIGIGDRHVRVAAEADFLEQRGPYLNFIKDTNQTAQWLIFGKDDQAASEDVDEDPHLFKTLREAVDWWRDLMFFMTQRTQSLPADKVMELSDCVQNLERGHFRKNPGDHCRYCPVVDTCMGLRP